MAVGFDMLAAIAVLDLQVIYPEIKLIAAVPFPGQELRYNNEDKILYAEIWEQCDEVVIIDDYFSYDLYFKRNDYMLDSCSTLVCYFSGSEGGTKYTVEKAQRKCLEVTNLCQ